MLFSRKKSPKKLKFLLLAVIFVILGAIITAFVGQRYITFKPDKILAPIAEKANISLGKVYQEALRNGIKDWSLNAGSAKYFNEKKQVVFKDLSVTFFLEDEGEIRLTANKGILQTGSKDIEVTGNVVVINNNYRLSTEKLYYDNNKRIIISKAPVKISSDGFNFAAESISLNLNSNKVILEGKVIGNFSAKNII